MFTTKSLALRTVSEIYNKYLWNECMSHLSLQAPPLKSMEGKEAVAKILHNILFFFKREAVERDRLEGLEDS